MHRTALIVALVATLVPTARAATITLESTTPGVVWDGIVDGFPMFASKDGTGDFGGNPLSVVRKGDVTEVRSVMEFPLSALAGAAPADVIAATLTFNVDDVLSTLGPGTDLNNEAADTILVHFYDGDGEARLNDFGRTAEPAIPVDTGPGVVTDATLRQRGPIVLTVDALARVQQALAEGTPFLGVLWRTNDSPTGTSIDDGRGGSVSGDPSDTVPGSHMPFLTIEMGTTVSTTTTTTIPLPPPPPNCGNGVLDDGEQCDGGNVDNGDCCSRLCTLDAADTTCSDGNACTDGDHCDGAGTCLPGGPRSCDDGSPCTSDSCDPASGCVTAPANDGASCDDGTACTSNDVCTAGACRGTPACGNGIIDAACDEECDDGNTAGLDGCSERCRLDTVLGGSGARECLVRPAFGGTLPDTSAAAVVQTCTDGDPSCDADPAGGVCGFVVGACFGLADARLPGCGEADTVTPAVLKPGRSGRDRATRQALEAALDRTAMPGCTGPVTVHVAVRRKGKRTVVGKTALVLSARAAGAGRDRDTVRLVCRPAS